ncbi:MAG TPA: dispase autolysis-inducing protein [Thermoanaerobaculia bacterium]|nr:dispase autolysis-inducing protein [Thermoanaerobaculia bacterium]
MATPTQFPQCSMVTGLPSVSFSTDRGTTVTKTDTELHGLAYTYGLTATPNANVLYAFTNAQLFRTNDAGCSWSLVAEDPDILGQFPPTLAAAGTDRVYIWSDNRSYTLRYDTATGLTKLKQPADFLGFAVDPANPDHVRAGGSDGAIHESTDGGVTWNRIGALETSGEIIYRYVFDAKDLNHIVAGMTRQGAFVTHDGGRTWLRATGIAKGMANVFNFAISPVDSNYVWAMTIDLAETDTAPSFGRYILLSTDGGATYRRVIGETPEVQIVNQPVMVADPVNRDILYFVFGTYFQDYGTDIYRVDASTNSVLIAHNDYDDVNAIAFSPADPNVMYLGLEVQEVH